MLELTDQQLFPSEVATEFTRNDQLVVESQRNVQTIETLPLDGDRRFSMVVKFPIFDDDREVAFVGGIAIDVTERHEAEEALAEALQSVEALKTTPAT